MTKRASLEHLAMTLVQIMEAGLRLDDANPYFIYLFDANDQPWPKLPRDMGREDILEYIRHRWPQFAKAAAAIPDLTEH